MSANGFKAIAQEERLSIYRTDEGAVVIADSGAWLPGAYDREETARCAADLSDAELGELNDRICHIDRENRLITMADLPVT